jgi:hypothetical protein
MRRFRFAPAAGLRPAKVYAGDFAYAAPGAAIVALCLALFMVILQGLPAQAGQRGIKEPADKRLTDLGGTRQEDEGEPSAAEFEFAGIAARLNGLLELNYEYLDPSDTDDRSRNSRSDVFVGTLGLALRLFFNDWSKASIAVAAEDVGKEGKSGRVLLDEATVTLKCPWAPLYFVGGKTLMPFGAFENHLVSGTLTEDLYEIDQWGAIIGSRPGFLGADVSFAVYKDPEVIKNLSNFNPGAYRSRRREESEFQSYALRAALEPLADTLFVKVFYDSEPGIGKRNQSVGGALTADIWKFSLDLEGITALTREKGKNNEENKESAWLVGLSFDLLEDVELAARYEVFLDDDIGRQDEVLDYRLVAGFNYSFLEHATVSFEYGFAKFEREKGSPAADRQDAIQVQLALEF